MHRILSFKKYVRITINIFILATLSFLLIQNSPLANAAEFTVEYRGFEFEFEQFGTIYTFVSGLPNSPFQISADGKHIVKDIVPKFDDMSYRDYTFDGWNLKKKGGVIDRKKIYRAGDTISDINSDIQLIAVWKRKEADIIIHSLHTYLRGGDPKIIEGTSPKEELLKLGDEIKLKRCPYNYDGHYFIGWLDSKGNLYEAGDTYIVESYNSIFTAAWILDSENVVKNSISYSSGAVDAEGKSPNSIKLYNKNSFIVADCTYSYKDHIFKGWSDSEKVYQPGETYIVKGDGDIVFTAVWECIIPSFEINITSSSGGEISPDGSLERQQGEQIEIHAIPNDGFIISKITVNGEDFEHINGLILIEDIKEDKEIIIDFEKKRFIFNVVAGEGGDVSPKGEIEFEFGDKAEISIIADDGYVIDKILVDGVEQVLTSLSSSLIFKDIDYSHDISISFKSNKTSITSTENSDVVSEGGKTGVWIALAIVIASLSALGVVYFVKYKGRI